MPETNANKPSGKFNPPGLKLVGAIILACISLSFLVVKWMGMKGAGQVEYRMEESQLSIPQSGSNSFPAMEVHAMLRRGDVDALKKLLDGAGDRRTEWGVYILEAAALWKNDASFDFVLDGLEERISHEPAWLSQKFEVLLINMGSMAPKVQADVLLKVKSFSSDPKKIARVRFQNRAILEHKVLRDAVVKICNGNMPEPLLRELLGQCQFPNDWTILCELLEDQDEQARSAVIFLVATSGDKIWKSSSLSSILNLCDEQTLNKLADYCISGHRYEPLEKLLASGAKVSLQSVHFSEIAKEHPQLWKEVIARLTQDDLEKLWWEEITSSPQLDELKLWEDRLQLVINVPKRVSSQVGVTALEHLVENPNRWEICEWLIQHKAKLPKSKSLLTKLFLAVAQNQRHQVADLISSGISSGSDKIGVDRRRELLHSAIRLGHAATCGVLTESFAKLGPNDAVLYAIEREQWACIQEMLNNGHELQSDEVLKLSEKAPGGIAAMMADVNREITPKTISILMESAIDRNDEAGLAIAIRKAQTLSDKTRDKNGLVSLDSLLGKEETNRLVGLALSRPRSLEMLQFQGFTIDFDHLLNSVRDTDVQAAEVCLRSILMMNLSESDLRQLKGEVEESQSPEIRKLFEELGYSQLDAASGS